MARPVWNVKKADGSTEGVPASIAQLSATGDLMFGEEARGVFDCQVIFAKNEWMEARKSSLVQ